MRAVAGVEDRIVFEDDDGGFDGIEGVAAGFENSSSRREGRGGNRLCRRRRRHREYPRRRRER